MANKQLQTNTKLTKGMYLDVHPLNQPPGTYRFALNLVNESSEGDLYSFTTEEGNQKCFTLLPTEVIMGSIYLGNNDVLLFVHNTSSGLSKIGIVGSNCVFTELIVSSCLNFDIRFPISGIYRIKNGCDRVIYFTDNYNPFRSINIDGLIQYTNLDGSGNHYTVDFANLNDEWNCTLFKFNPDFNIPEIDLDSVTAGGGQLMRGMYHFALRYLDNEFNPTSWISQSQGINIAGGNPSSYDSVDGGNADLTGNELFPENKVINLDINNLDLNFPYFQLSVFVSTNGVLNEPEVYELPIQQIDNASESYSYKGFSIDETPTTSDAVVIPAIKFNKVKTIAQVDNRLFLGNTQEDNKDWAEFQRQSSQVIVTAQTGALVKNSALNASTNESSKSAFYVFDRKSYMRDEIYALGIVYVFKDGTESPVFHIPGRPKDEADAGGGVTFTNQQLVTTGNSNTHNRNLVQDTSVGDPVTDLWDSSLLTVVSTIVNPKVEVLQGDVEHIPLTEFTNPLGPRLGNTIERWKVVNTAVEYSTNSFLMGYTECDEVYPDIEDCNGNSIWGTDYTSTALAGTPVRHHRMPDTILTASSDGSEGRPAGDAKADKQSVVGTISPLRLQVTNVNYPAAYASDIQGYYIVRVERTSETETVADKGIMGAINTLPGSVENIGLPNNRNFAAVDLAGNPVNFAGGASNNALFISPKTQFDQSIKQVDYFKCERILEGWTDVTTKYHLYETQKVPNRNDFINRASTGYFYIEPDSFQDTFAPFTVGVWNRNLDMSFYVFYHLYDKYTPPGTTPEHPYMAAKYWRKPYGNLFSLQYINTGALLTSTGVGAEFVWGGDTFISELTWKNTSDIYVNDLVHLNLYCESTINSELRNHGTETWEDHIRHYPSWIADFFAEDEFPDDPANDWSNNYFRYDEHYSQEANYFTYFPLPIQWDYCSECPNTFPYRIWYSERAYQEELTDNYKQVLANNYQDLLGDGGEVSKLFVQQDQLYCLAENAAWFIPSRPQQLTTNEGNIQVGTGDVFSVPPKRLQTVERGYGGTIDPHSLNVSEFGATWVDRNSQRIFQLGQGLMDISNKGMRSWFIKNIPLNIKKQLPEFNNFNTIHPNGAGYISTYDPRHARTIITKKDYRIIDDSLLIQVQTTDGYVLGTTYGFNTQTGEFYTWPSGPSETILDWQSDPDIIEDLSWTISYSHINQAWDSFHSYRPAWMWHNQDYLYTSRYQADSGGLGNSAWIHNDKDFHGRYYGVINEAAIDFVANDRPGVTKVLDSLVLYTKSEDYVGEDLNRIIYDTFDELHIYNSNETTGLITLNPKNTEANPFSNVFESPSDALIDRNEHRWSVSQFDNLRSDLNEPILTSDWSNAGYQNNRRLHGYLYYPNDASYDTTKNIFERGPLRDQWFGIQLIYSNNDGYKFTFDYLSTMQNISFK